MVLYIPGGCTSVLQTLNVGMNMPLKAQLFIKFHAWYNSMMHETGENKLPPRELVAQWSIDAWYSISPTIWYNIWRHGPISIFPLLVEELIKETTPKTSCLTRQLISESEKD
jgi:hypothetical protein